MQKKTVLITGANRGIGYESAFQLAKKGFTVFLSARDAKEGATAVSHLKAAGDCCFVQMDVENPESIQKAFEKVSAQTASLDVLINNAGIYPDPMPSLLETPESSIRQAFETNVLGPIRVIRAFYPLLEKSKAARIINVSGGAGSLKEMGISAPAYSISKTALNAVTRQFSLLFQEGIAVNSVCPGWVRTRMGGPHALRPVEKGAETIIWLASEAPQTLSGMFFRDKKEILW